MILQIEPLADGDIRGGFGHLAANDCADAGRRDIHTRQIAAKQSLGVGAPADIAGTDTKHTFYVHKATWKSVCSIACNNGASADGIHVAMPDSASRASIPRDSEILGALSKIEALR
ncbi:hypothetical protein GCM10028792_31090 [Salinisphaera aquimarina]